MTPESILSKQPKILTEPQRKFFFLNGYLVLDGFMEQQLLNELQVETIKFIEESRHLKNSTKKFDFETGHSANSPRLRRVTQPVKYNKVFWKTASNSLVTDIAEDLLGPDVMFHHSKLNFKWFSGGDEVKWHQDFPFWPHTNDSVLTIGIYLENVDHIMGPLAIMPKTHCGKIFDHYNNNNKWTGAISLKDMATLELDKAVYLTGKAGSITVHHSRTLHGSKPNLHPSRSRPLLLNTFSSADALPITPNPTPSSYDMNIVRGSQSQTPHKEEYSLRMPPDWSKGYTSIFSIQKEG